MPTYKDIQARTGLSLSTISKYFNDGALRAENRAAIEEAARSLGFRRNGFARSLRTRRSSTVGVIVPELDNSFHMQVIAGLHHALMPHGVSITVTSVNRGVKEFDDALQFLADRMVDGIVVVPASTDGPALRRFATTGIPVVLVDRLLTPGGYDSVVLDNSGAGATAADHLADRGHTGIACIGGPGSIWTMHERHAGFAGALDARGIPIRSEHYQVAPLTVAGGHTAMRRLLALDVAPSAVFCMNYELTVGALIAINESGRTLPGDMSFIGFDSPELAQLTTPKLTMITQPIHEIARRAAALIWERIDRPAPGSAQTRIVLSAALIEGDSVASAGSGPRT